MISLDSIGIVVIGRNEGERLVACLQSIGAAPQPLVYVDSGSIDGSPARARALGALVIDLDLSIPFTAARARNKGYAALRSLAPELNFVQFIDGDCELASDWLSTGLAFLQENSLVAVVCGRRRERHPERSVYNRLIDGEWNTPIGEAAACGGDALMRIAAFDAVRGFDDALMAGEEPELCSRLRQAGWRIWRLDANMTVHDADMHRFGQWWRRGVRSGYGYAQVFAATRRTAAVLYRRELLRSLVWAGAVPGALLLFSLFAPLAALAGLGIYVLQTVRVAKKRGWRDPLSWAYACAMTVGKFAELRGAITFSVAAFRRRTLSSIDYKAG